MKRGDIERAKEVEREQVEQERTQKKRKLETDEVAASNAAASRETTPALEQIKFVPLPRDEVVRRLRALVQPITFFGESDEERQRRLHQIELIVSERQSTSSAGAQKNIFQLMSESVDAEIEAAIAAGSHSADDSKDDGANQANRSDDESGDERADGASAFDAHFACNHTLLTSLLVLHTRVLYFIPPFDAPRRIVISFCCIVAAHSSAHRVFV